ncbi:TraR/DksA family transcriptional regulator [Microbulbifer sp. ANSA002]|uniref:TraR/DksA family transcriptional regulator n=1 Tax=unclassified Microbulbifer TaxID=2619833 RepID=UPI004041405D
MPDDLDRASVLEQAQRQRALQAQRQRSNFDVPSLAQCEDCDGDIPKARQAFGGVTRCVECQTEYEKWGH